jgi:hypothetical protein
MKVSINDQELFTLSETQKKVIKNDIADDIFESDMRRRLHYIIEHPCDRWINENSKENRDLFKKHGKLSVPSDRLSFMKELCHCDVSMKLDPSDDKDLCLKVDGVEHCTFQEDHKMIWKKMKGVEYQHHMCEALEWILTHKFERCMERLRLNWEPKLKALYPSIPTDDEDFANIVFSQPDYKNKSACDAESHCNI